jgi:uracil-DNA glycosylase
MQLPSLLPHFERLQILYGSPDLATIPGAGNINRPDICLVFMNPIAKNISSSKDWKGLRAPWIGTKQVWAMLADLGIFSQELSLIIQTKKPADWTPEFSQEIYDEVARSSLYITNLSKATQEDARPLPNAVFREYLDLFFQEIITIKPRLIIAFWNQVSSLLTWENISVNAYRKKSHTLQLADSSFPVYPVYYPVGQGRRNMPLAKEDIAWILLHHIGVN